MSRNRKKTGLNSVVVPIVLVLSTLAVLAAMLLQGNNIALFNSAGLIASEQRRLIVLTVGIMLAVAIPAVALLYFTAWRYRETNTKVQRNPDAGRSKQLVVAMWLLPITIMLILASIMWPATHRLEPQKQIASSAEPMTVQVIALRWKWLFIYPEQKIATVNYVQVPTGTPVTFELTADEAPMSSFWIPNWGGMLYAMAGGHVNRLNLMAEKPGEYPGSTAEINGAGFAGMRFTASATSKDDFDKWVREVSLTSDVLDDAEYAELLKPSENNPEGFYTLTGEDLYAKVIKKYTGAHAHGAEGEHQHAE